MNKLARQLFMVATICLLGLSSLMAQDRTVSGTVSDSAGRPVALATVAERGTRNSTVSKEDGSFTLKVTSARPMLVISSVGFATQEVPTNGASTVSVTMQGNSSQLTDVVVTALGITKKQRGLGYATTTIKADELTRVAQPNFASALYGKAPGVRIASAPGGATSAVNIQIRGINSITGRNQPLIVLDGVPIRSEEVSNNNYWGDQRLRGNGLLDLNPEDIENISILKGSSAAALYGAEAVNGVVLVTTKTGRGSKGLTVDANVNYNVSTIAYLPRYQNVRGAGAPIHVSNGGQEDDGFAYIDKDGDGVKETRALLGYSINFGPKFDGQPIMSWDGVTRPYEAQKDNYKNMFQNAKNSGVNVSVSQSTENASIRLSLTRQDNEGISMGSKNSKNIANLNTSLRLGKKWTTDVMINYINQYTKNRPYSIDRMVNNFTGMIGRFDNPDWYYPKLFTSKGYRYVTGTGQSLTPDENIIYAGNGFRGDLADYLYRVKAYRDEEWSNRLIASMTHNWQILPFLKLRGRLATDYTTMKTESRQPNSVPLSIGNSGYFGMANYNNTIVYGDLLMTYTQKFGPDFTLNVMGGYTATTDKTAQVSRGTNGGLSTENKYDISSSVNTAGSDSYRRNMVKDAFIGTVNFDYKSIFFVEGTVRRDRVSTMAPGQNTFVYPSINSSFVFSDALDLPGWMTYGKLRASYGVVGNYPDIYNANIAYNQNTLGVQAVGGQSVLYTTIPSTFGNDGVKAELKYEYEVGLETKFFNNRLGLDITFYNGQIRDQILPLTLPASSGASSVLTNIGTLRNKGIEIGFNATPVQTKNFRWDLVLNYAKNTNVVEKLANNATELLHSDYDGNAAQLKSVVGQPMGDFYAHPIARNAKGEAIVNPDGLYKIDADSMYKVGNAMPKAVGGFINSFTYKGFHAEVVIDYRFGGYIMPTGIYWMISRGLLKESLNAMDEAHGGLAYYLDADGKGIQTTGSAGPNGEKVFHDGMLMPGVTEDGQKNTNVMSQAYYYWNTYNWGGPQYSSSRYELYIQKNSYVKLRELSLGYDLPMSVTKKVGAKKLNFSVFGRNLFFIYRTIKDMDPEQTTAGSRWFQTLNNAGTNPATRTYGVMLRASF